MKFLLVDAAIKRFRPRSARLTSISTAEIAERSKAELAKRINAGYPMCDGLAAATTSAAVNAEGELHVNGESTSGTVFGSGKDQCARCRARVVGVNLRAESNDGLITEVTVTSVALTGTGRTNCRNYSRH